MGRLRAAMKVGRSSDEPSTSSAIRPALSLTKDLVKSRAASSKKKIEGKGNDLLAGGGVQARKHHTRLAAVAGKFFPGSKEGREDILLLGEKLDHLLRARLERVEEGL